MAYFIYVQFVLGRSTRSMSAKAQQPQSHSILRKPVILSDKTMNDNLIKKNTIINTPSVEKIICYDKASLDRITQNAIKVPKVFNFQRQLVFC